MAVRHPEDWTSHARGLIHWLLRRWGCVCRWCKHGEEHHGVGRRQDARIEDLEMVLHRCRHELLHNPSIIRDIDARLNEVEI